MDWKKKKKKKQNQSHLQTPPSPSLPIQAQNINKSMLIFEAILFKTESFILFSSSNLNI